MDVTRVNMDELVHQLLGKRKRRFAIMYRWNFRQPIRGETMTDIVRTLMETLLHKPFSVSITHEGILLWKTEPGLLIPYKWLLKEEREWVKQLFLQRKHVFQSIRKSENGQFEMSNISLQPTLSIFARRELVRDFVLLCHIQKPARMHALRYAILQAIQQLIVRGNRVDPMLASIMRLLNNQCGVDMLMTHDVCNWDNNNVYGSERILV